MRVFAAEKGCRRLGLPIDTPDGRTTESRTRIESIGFAEAWVEEPEEPRRRKALASGNAGDTRSSATWVALAAGWSGGSIVPDDKGYAPAPPEQTAKAVRVALFIALSRLEEAAKPRIMTTCLQDGIQLASEGSVSSQ